MPPTVSPPPNPHSGPVIVTAGHYDAGRLQRWVLGDQYRDLWTTPLTVPVLDPGAYRGGLHPVRDGGGFETVSLHLRDAEGRYYLFRSVDKWVNQGLEPDLRGTPTGWVIQDQTKALHPVGALMLSPILEAVGVPYTVPELFVMGDHPVLGEYRERFAGMLGTLVESPDDGPDHDLHFLGSDQVLGSGDLLQLLAQSPAHRVDDRALLKARLVDLLVGDFDRGFGQWRWLRYGPEGAWTWSGSPLDRDAGFIMADGLIGIVGRRIERKYVRFDDKIDVVGLIASVSEVDRLLLAGLDRAAWESIAAEVQAAVTDDVIREAVQTLPPEYRARMDDFLPRHLTSRRDHLTDAARRFYALLAGEVDVQATDADEIAVVERFPDGSLTVRVSGPRRNGKRLVGDEDEEPATYYHRRFLPTETHEVRIYLRGGRDRVTVLGSGSPITVRVIGGPGDDVFADATSGGAGSTVFYDHEGENRFDTAGGARVDRRGWERPAITGFQEHKVKDLRDFGRDVRLQATVDYGDGPGVILGVGSQLKTYGFRQLPFSRKVELVGEVGVSNGGLGISADWQEGLEGTSHRLRGTARASRGLTSGKFYGFGNTSSHRDLSSEFVGDEVVVGAEMEFSLGDSLGTLSVGPRLRYADPKATAESALATDRPLGWDGFGSVGIEGRLELDGTRQAAMQRRGIAIEGEVSASPPVWSARDWFGRASMEARGFLPAGGSTTLALRLGGRGSWGGYPFQDASHVGGRGTLRGFSFDRFAGDAAAYGGVEWRVPISRLTLLTRGDLGAFGLADFGRVWWNGRSPEGWHSGYGGGLWYQTLGVSGSVAIARGERTALYVTAGTRF